MKDLPSILHPVDPMDTHLFEHVIDEFFEDIQNHIRQKNPHQPVEFSFGDGEIKLYHDGPSDDTMRCLYCKDIPIAVVTETRTDFNYVKYTFFRNLEGLKIRNLEF